MKSCFQWMDELMASELVNRFIEGCKVNSHICRLAEMQEEGITWKLWRTDFKHTGHILNGQKSTWGQILFQMCNEAQHLFLFSSHA